jgi:VPDSG-CTERM motif
MEKLAFKKNVHLHHFDAKCVMRLKHAVFRESETRWPIICYGRCSCPINPKHTKQTNMKLLKYITLVGVLCVGLTSLARATLNDLGEQTVKSGDKFELAEFIALAPEHADATICAKIGASNDVFTITVVDATHISVEFDLTGTGRLVCGFATKDGQGLLEHFYSVDADQGAASPPGGFILEVPGNGANALSHLTVFCCPGGVVTPDSGTTAMLLGGALTGLGVVRRYLKR